MRDLADKLRTIRRYTGDRFSSARGYDLRKSISRARMRTIARYFEVVMDLTARPHKVFTPPKGTKRETFEYTGQKHHPRFTKAIVLTPDPEAQYSFSIDKKRPKGSRFVVTNRKTHERSWHIPAQVFLDENEALYDEDEDIPPEFFAEVLEDYAERGEVYLIEAGENHMWGSAGSIARVSEKLSSLFKEYGAGTFDPYDKNSHFIGNWFNGIQVYSDARDYAPYMQNRVQAEAKRLEERGLEPFTKFRALKSGAIGRFYKGELVQVIQPPTSKPKASKFRRKR